MLKRVIFASIGALIAVPSAHAATVTFEDQAAFRCDQPGNGASGGLSYSSSFATCYYSPAAPADFPTPVTSTVMASGYAPTTFTLTAGGAFNLATVDLAFGPFQHNGLTSDTTTVTGLTTLGGTLTATLPIGYGFTTQTLGWNDLQSVTFSQPDSSSEYLAFDNIVYSVTGAVPEPTTWAMMILGFGILGFGMRKRSNLLAPISYA